MNNAVMICVSNFVYVGTIDAKELNVAMRYCVPRFYFIFVMSCFTMAGY